MPERYANRIEMTYNIIIIVRNQNSFLLISRANTLQLVGSCVFVRKEPNRDIVLSDKVLRLIPKQNADSRFLLYSLRTSNSRKQIQTMSTGNQDSMRNIGQDRLKKINLECPPLPTQQRIVQEIETRLSACDVMEKNIAESLQQSEALRQSILKKAFSGSWCNEFISCLAYKY